MISQEVVHMFIDSEGNAVNPAIVMTGDEIFPLHRVTETTVHFDYDGSAILIVFTHRLGHMVQGS